MDTKQGIQEKGKKRSKKSAPYRVPRVLNKSQVEQLFSAVGPRDPSSDLILIKCLFYLCLRISEALSLTKKDFIKEFTEVRIRGKGGTDMVIPIPSVFRPELKRYISRIMEDTLFDIKRTTAWHRVKKYAGRAGLDSWVHPHTLRHSGATHLYKIRPDIKALQRFLRHRSISSTSIYTHVDLEQVRNLVNEGFK